MVGGHRTLLQGLITEGDRPALSASLIWSGHAALCRAALPEPGGVALKWQG